MAKQEVIMYRMKYRIQIYFAEPPRCFAAKWLMIKKLNKLNSFLELNIEMTLGKHFDLILSMKGKNVNNAYPILEQEILNHFSIRNTVEYCG